MQICEMLCQMHLFSSTHVVGINSFCSKLVSGTTPGNKLYLYLDAVSKQCFWNGI